jgi:hypothetical protein
VTRSIPRRHLPLDPFLSVALSGLRSGHRWEVRIRAVTQGVYCRERGCPDGSIPDAALVPAGESKFYEITDNGGTSNYGTVLRLAIPRECTVCPNVE